ncbi:MAG: PAS domain S-box protein [Phycisphaeraceae bacterium]|nr:PAS domain S-box protein [Phycisphaeraceae bacterium]
MRGESVVAWAGLSLCALLLGTLAGLVWWSARSQDDLASRDRDQRIASIRTMVASASAPLIASQNWPALTRLLIDAANDDAVARASIVLADGRTLASSDGGSESEAPTAPWPTLPTEAPGSFEVPGSGRALVDLQPEAPRPAAYANWELATGVAAVGVVGLLALLAVYRRLRKRLAGVGAVQEALQGAVRGDPIDSLGVHEDLGPSARAWNSLLAMLTDLRAHVAKDRAADALATRRSSRSDLHQACDALWLGFAVVDDHLCIRYANGAAAIFLETAREQLEGASVLSVIAHEPAQQALSAMARREIKQRRSFEIERDGNRGVLRLTIRPLRQEDAGVAMILIEDITQQRVAEQAQNSFVAQATHELRTPLTNIILYLDEAIDLPEEDSQGRSRCLNVINQEARRLERLVADMLSVSEMQAGAMALELGDVRLDRVFEDLQNDYAAQARSKSIELTFDLPPKLPVIRADRDRLTMAMHNLLGNALKYTPEGGEVAVRVVADEARLTFEVRDSGIGIAEADQPKVFEAFYRSEDARGRKIGGTGLGLALAREVVRLHGGEITLDSALGKGSTFTLSLPCARATDHAIAA